MDYVKTRNLEPTRHLFVGNCGPHLGFAKEDIEIIFRPFSSSVYVHFSRDNASHCYVTLASAADATEALQQLTGKACAAARGRTLIMSYCEVKEQRQVQSIRKMYLKAWTLPSIMRNKHACWLLLAAAPDPDTTGLMHHLTYCCSGLSATPCRPHQ